MKRHSNSWTARRSALARRGGFTVVELLVRLAVIFGLVSVLNGVVERAVTSARRAEAKRETPKDLMALCEALDEIADERAREYPLTYPFPRILWQIVDRFPSEEWPYREFEKLDGGDVTANGMRYTLEIDPVYVTRHGLSLIHDGHLKFAICATPYSSELLDTEYCIKYDRQQGGCLGIWEIPINDPDYEDRKQAFLEELAYELVASAMEDGVSPEDLADLMRLVDLNAVKQTVMNFDADGDHVLTLQEIKDLEQSPIFGDLVHLVVEFNGFGKYGERTDIGVPLEDLIIDESPVNMFTEYYAPGGALQLEAPSGEIDALAASVDAAQKAVDGEDLSRELNLMHVIQGKVDRAWLRERLSTDGADFFDYSLQLRKEVLDGEEF